MSWRGKHFFNWPENSCTSKALGGASELKITSDPPCHSARRGYLNICNVSKSLWNQSGVKANRHHIKPLPRNFEVSKPYTCIAGWNQISALQTPLTQTKNTHLVCPLNIDQAWGETQTPHYCELCDSATYFFAQVCVLPGVSTGCLATFEMARSQPRVNHKCRARSPRCRRDFKPHFYSD